MNTSTCTLCSRDVTAENIAVKLEEYPDFPMVQNVKCGVCGEYYISQGARLTLKEGRIDTALFPAFMRTESPKALGFDYTLVLLNEESQAMPNKHAVGLGRIIQTTKTYTVSERLDRVLLYIGAKSKKPGHVILNAVTPDFRWTEQFPFYLCEDAKAAGYIENALVQLGYIENRNGLMITVAGWAKISELRTSHPSESNQAFVAMCMNEDAFDMQDAFTNGIEPAILAAGYRPFAINREPVSDNTIDMEILAQIRRSKFMVVDFSGQRTAVYYEAGFAQALGKQVIWMCHEGDAENLSFDTEHYQHIMWKTPDDIREQLQWHVEAKVGRGSYNADERSV